MRAIACGVIAIYFLELARYTKKENWELRGMSVFASWLAIGFAFVTTILGV